MVKGILGKWGLLGLLEGHRSVGDVQYTESQSLSVAGKVGSSKGVLVLLLWVEMIHRARTPQRTQTWKCNLYSGFQGIQDKTLFISQNLERLNIAAALALKEGQTVMRAGFD